MMSIPIPPCFYPCLAIPLVELFPDLCLGWFTPPNLNLKQYKKMWYLRLSLQSIAWFPLFEMLLPICPDSNRFSLLVIGTISSILLRNFLMKKDIERITSIPMWNDTTLPWDKRQALFVVASNARPSDINKFDEMASRYVTLPTKIAAAVMYGITNVAHEHLPEKEKMHVMVALATFVIGGIGISGTRHGSTTLDCIFRCVFGAGFIAILHYLAEASDIVMIKSIQ